MNNRLLAALLTLPLAASCAHAQDSSDGSAFKISGFGTAALTATNTDDAEFTRGAQARGAGKSARTGVDSALGLQVDGKVNDWLSLTGQGVVHKSGIDDNYGADLTWAFAKAKLSEEVSVRVGRLGLPVFMISEYLDVGYANTMLRPAQEVYSQVPAGSIDGIDVTWQKTISETSFTAQAAIGRTNADDAVVSSEKAVNFVVEHGPFSARLGRAEGNLTLKFAPVQTKVSFTAIGLAMDWNNIVFQSEAAKTQSFGTSAKSWYTMAGYRFGKVLPYYNHAKLSRADGQSTDSIGVRWDAFRSAAIKFQFDHVKPQNVGLFAHAKPGFKGPVNVAALSVDFIF